MEEAGGGAYSSQGESPARSPQPPALGDNYAAEIKTLNSFVKYWRTNTIVLCERIRALD